MSTRVYFIHRRDDGSVSYESNDYSNLQFLLMRERGSKNCPGRRRRSFESSDRTGTEGQPQEVLGLVRRCLDESLGVGVIVGRGMLPVPFYAMRSKL